MRPACLMCTAKHISKAIILLSESELGYPTHHWLALGNLSEAEEECLVKFPQLAERIREVRLKIEKDVVAGLELHNILKEVIELINIEE